MSESTSLAAAALDTLPMNVAILDAEGEIVFTNRAWREFAGTDTDDVGRDYLAASEATDDKYASRANDAIRSILAGDRTTFQMEYPCHSPDRKRWFLMRAVRFSVGGDSHVSVAHLDITERKLAEIEAAETNEALKCERHHQEHLLDRINDLVSEVTLATVQAATREELERRACELFAGTDSYIAAWIGRRDLSSEMLRPVAWAGTGDGFLEDHSFRLGADSDVHPAVVAAETGASQVARVGSAVLEDDPVVSNDSDPGAVVAVPLSYQEMLYGVLVVYVRGDDLNDEHEIAVLESLARTLASAVNAVERNRIMTTSEVVDLAVTVADRDLLFVDLAAATDCRLDHRGSMYDAEGDLQVVFAVEGPVDDLLARAADAPAVVSAHRLETGESDLSFVEFTVRNSLVSRMADQGALTRDFSVMDGQARFRVEVSDEAVARKVFNAVESTYDSVDLVEIRNRERSAQTRAGYRTTIRDRLTDRQYEVLWKAYANGYFNSPRLVSGDQLAESMGVSRPTFHQHLRVAQRKVFETLFDEA